MLIKVCGMAHAENARQVADAAPDMMGFIFYSPSPRSAFGLAAEEVRSLPTGIKRVGVFVDESESVIIEKVKDYGLDYVQLHGNESPDFCRGLRGKVPCVIKAFGIATTVDLENITGYEGLCDFYVFDTKTASKGGSGQKFDHGILRSYHGVTPFLLSGGIGPEDSDIARDLHQLCAGLDVNSRFETSPGTKDIPALREFINEIKNIEI